MHDRGVIVVAEDPFGETPRRPYLLVSGDDHPFAGEQYIALGISTKEYAASLPLEDAYDTGSLTQPSFVSPWAVVSLRATDIDRAVARVTTGFVDSAASELTTYID